MLYTMDIAHMVETIQKGGGKVHIQPPFVLHAGKSAGEMLTSPISKQRNNIKQGLYPLYDTVTNAMIAFLNAETCQSIRSIVNWKVTIYRADQAMLSQKKEAREALLVSDCQAYKKAVYRHLDHPSIIKDMLEEQKRDTYMEGVFGRVKTLRQGAKTKYEQYKEYLEDNKEHIKTLLTVDNVGKVARGQEVQLTVGNRYIIFDSGDSFIAVRQNAAPNSALVGQIEVPEDLFSRGKNESFFKKYKTQIAKLIIVSNITQLGGTNFEFDDEIPSTLITANEDAMIEAWIMEMSGNKVEPTAPVWYKKEGNETTLEVPEGNTKGEVETLENVTKKRLVTTLMRECSMSDNLEQDDAYHKLSIQCDALDALVDKVQVVKEKLDNDDQLLKQIAHAFTKLLPFCITDSHLRWVWQLLLNFQDWHTLVTQHYNHVFIMGDAGYGKTSLARAIATLYASLYLVVDADKTKDKDFFVAELVETIPSDYNGASVGEGGIKTLAKLMGNLEKVVLIDEAYQLIVKNPNTGRPSQDVISELLAFQTNRRGQSILILAGYESKMFEFMAANIGIKRRFQRPIIIPLFDGETAQNVMTTLSGVQFAENSFATMYDKCVNRYKFRGVKEGSIWNSGYASLKAIADKAKASGQATMESLIQAMTEAIEVQQSTGSLAAELEKNLIGGLKSQP